MILCHFQFGHLDELMCSLTNSSAASIDIYAPYYYLCNTIA